MLKRIILQILFELFLLKKIVVRSAEETTRAQVYVILFLVKVLAMTGMTFPLNLNSSL